MGICASCLGRQRSEQYDEDDMSRLLFQDGNNAQYGSFGDDNMNQHADPVESQRQSEALQSVVARLSSNLVDVEDVAPESQGHFSGHEARLARYQSIMSNISQGDGNGAGADWLAVDEEDENEPAHTTNGHPVKEGRDPLVGTFADATTSVA